MSYVGISALDYNQNPLAEIFGLEVFKDYDTAKSVIAEKDISEVRFFADTYFPEEHLVQIANAVSVIKSVYPETKTRLDLRQCILQGSAFAKYRSKKSFSTLANLINAIEFDYVDLPPIRHDAANLFTNSEVSVMGLMLDHGWAPQEPLNIDTICFANSEVLCEMLSYLHTIQDSSPDIFVKYSGNNNIDAVCACGFKALEDTVAAGILESYSVPKRVGYPVIRKGETWKDANLTGKRVLIAMYSYTFDMCYEIAELVTMLKSMGASYIAFYSYQTEMSNGENLYLPGMELIDDWFCKYANDGNTYLEDDQEEQDTIPSEE